MNRKDVKKISSVTCQELGQGLITLVENQDYEIFSDATTLFLQITTQLKFEKQYNLTIKVLDKDDIEQDWKVSCLPKG